MSTVDFFTTAISMACGVGIVGGTIAAVGAYWVSKVGASRRGFSVTIGREVDGE